MNPTGSSFQRAASPGWQLLGELELAVNAHADREVGKWLAVILSPLDLRAAFMNKVLKSAQQATARTMQVETVIQFKQFKLLVFAPAVQASNGYNWGFFWIEKVKNAGDQDTPNHAIEFYLYQEGQW